MKLHKAIVIGIVFTFAICLMYSTESFACYTGPLYQVDCCETVGMGDMENYCCRTEDDCRNGITGNCRLNFPYRLFNPCNISPCLLREVLNDEVTIDTLRRFRDEVLSQTPIGQEYIRLYYQCSAAIVQAMEEDEEFKEEVKELVNELLPMIEQSLE